MTLQDRTSLGIDCPKADLIADVTLTRPSMPEQLTSLSRWLAKAGHGRESETIKDVYSQCTLSTEFGGLGLDPNSKPGANGEREIIFLVSAWLEALNSVDRSETPPSPLLSRPEGRRGMTLAEKLFAMHDVENRGSVKPGDMIRVRVDWVMASESSWAVSSRSIIMGHLLTNAKGMRRTYDKLGSPGIIRNDRFWLAGDHVVDPRINNRPEVKRLIVNSEKAKNDFKMTDYQGMNVSDNSQILY